MKAITAYVYKPKFGDCSNGGISNKYDEILLECEDGYLDITGNEENLCKVVKRDLRHIGAGIYTHIEPVKRSKGNGWMSGGTIVYCSDTRFREITGEWYPIKLHDRQEFNK